MEKTRKVFFYCIALNSGILKPKQPQSMLLYDWVNFYTS